MKRFSLYLALAIVGGGGDDAAARPPRFASRQATTPWTTSASRSSPAPASMPEIKTASGSGTNGIVTVASLEGAQEALDEVNAARAARGLPSYVRDPGLTQAAATIAVKRASRLTQGHTSNDFSGLPAGTTASAAGCAAWSPSMGWGSCCTYERYTYAGAAWAIGSDGRRYMQLFVR